MILRPGKTPSGDEIRNHLRRLVRRILDDSHYGQPQVMDRCDANGIDFVLGLAGNTILAGLVEGAVNDVRVRRAEARTEAVRGFAETRYKARSWKREKRTVARIEATNLGLRYVFTSLADEGSEHICAELYCARVQPDAIYFPHRRLLAHAHGARCRSRTKSATKQSRSRTPRGKSGKPSNV